MYRQNVTASLAVSPFMNFPGSHKKVWKLWARLINALKYIWQITRQTTRGKKNYQVGEKICSLLGKLLKVLHRGTFGFVRMKDLDGLLEAAQNVEEKRLSMEFLS